MYLQHFWIHVCIYSLLCEIVDNYFCTKYFHNQNWEKDEGGEIYICILYIYIKLDQLPVFSIHSRKTKINMLTEMKMFLNLLRHVRVCIPYQLGAVWNLFAGCPKPGKMSKTKTRIPVDVPSCSALGSSREQRWRPVRATRKHSISIKPDSPKR